MSWQEICLIVWLTIGVAAGIGFLVYARKRNPSQGWNRVWFVIGMALLGPFALVFFVACVNDGVGGSGD